MTNSIERKAKSAVALFALITFSTVQILPRAWAEVQVTGNEIQEQVPVKSVNTSEAQSTEPAIPQTSTDFLSGTLSPLSASDNNSTGLVLSIASAPSGPLPTGAVQIDQGGQSTSSREVNLTLQAIPGTILGDYNGNGTVDSADYTLWRNQSGSQGANLSADGDHDGDVDGSDYLIWQRNFGNALPPITGDANKNGTVDAADYTLWRNSLGWKKINPQDTNPADLDQDGDVDGADYLVWQRNFGKTYAITQMSFSTDGINWSAPEAYQTTKTFALPEGDGTKTIYVKYYDGMGNGSPAYSDGITLDTGPSITTLTDETKLHFQGGILVWEETPEGNDVFYRSDGSVEKFRYANGEEIHYVRGQNNQIDRYDSSNALVESIGIPETPVLNESQALKLTLDGGIEAYFVNGELVEFRTLTGIRITNFTFNSSNQIQDALITYQNGTREVIRNGALIRRINPDGSIIDFTPQGFAVREIISGAVQYFSFEKLSQTQVSGTKIFSPDGSFSRYDELGILREVKGSEGTHLIYDRTQDQDGDAYQTRLNLNLSSVPQSKTLLQGRYTSVGETLELKLYDGTNIQFNQGRISSVLNSAGQAIENYTYLESEGILKGLVIRRGGTDFTYDGTGFLSSISNASGTISRALADTDGDGSLSDEEIVQILLETVDGNTLSDFEIDSQGKIVNGIIHTKEGVKQFIQNYVLTGFETVDGKIYDYQNNVAVLREWDFKDGTRVLYGGGTISEILFSNHTRLHTLGFDAEKKIQSFVEEKDGVEKYFVNGKLVKLITSSVEIHYGANGLATEVILKDTQETQEVVYTRNGSDEIVAITFKGPHSSRTFSPDGTILSLLSGGVNAQYENGAVSKLFTRFGEIENPDFNQTGILSGEINLANDAKLIVSNGVLVQAVRSNGTKVNYKDGRIDSIEIGDQVYRVIYSGPELKIRLESEPGAPEFPLIPYLLKSDTMAGIGSEVGNPPNVVFNGGAGLDTSQFQFGDSSAHFDGQGDYVSISDSDDLDFGQGDFTIDFSVKFNHLDTVSFYSRDPGNPGGMLIQWNAGQGFVIGLGAYSVPHMFAWSPLTDVWYRVAITRNNGNLKVFINTAQIGSVQTDFADLTNSATAYIGSHSGSSQYLDGWMDEFRFSKGIARDFSQDSSAQEYTPDEFTKLLLHFNLSTPEPVSKQAVIAKELSEILLPRPLYNSLSDPSNIQSGLDIGQDIFFAKIIEDAVRGQTYEFGSDFFPEWLGVSNANNQLNSGFINQGISLSSLWWTYYYDFSSSTTTLIDINGDGLQDRVFADSSFDYWWAQLNTGSGFEAPIQWSGVNKTYNGTGQQLGSVRFYDVYGPPAYKLHPAVLGDLIDMNGDGLPDRVLQKSDGSAQWYVQFNNGLGFDPITEWHANLQPLQGLTDASKFASEVRNDTNSSDVMAPQYLVADLIDLDGDGLPDRVLQPYAAPFDHWFWQKNLGNGFAEATLWEGVDTSFNSDPRLASSLSWYDQILAYSDQYSNYIVANESLHRLWRIFMGGVDQPMAGGQWCDIDYCYPADFNDIMRDNPTFFGDPVRLAYGALVSTVSDLVDLNGDNKPDRILLKNKDLNNPNSAMDWYVQWNNGEGFDSPVLWDSDVRSLPNVASEKIATGIKVFYGWEEPRNVWVDLLDVTGDGLPDRISIDHADPGKSLAQGTWWVEVNNGHGFDPAVAWTGIYGTNAQESAIGQDNENFKTWFNNWGSPGFVKQVADLKDINGDGIPDRLIFKKGENRWLVQYGTGSGFLPVQEMQIKSLQAPTNQINTSRYDYLHVSLRSEANISSDMGTVRITLSKKTDDAEEIVQEWTVNNLTTNWQDFYLPIDKNKSNAGQVKITFVPKGTDPKIPIFTDNITFLATRPPDPKDWLNYLLTDENVLSEIHSDRNQTLAQYLGLTQTVDPIDFDWEKLLNAETRIEFDQGEATKFETFYGSISKVENGQVVETTLPSGNTVHFDLSGGNTLNQTVTGEGGAAVQTIQLTYGRVRTVERPGKPPLEYSYEFNSNGDEITVVFDPETKVKEKYRGKLLISRLEANGIEKQFTYNSRDELIQTDIVYKGQVRQTFYHSVSESGNQIITTEEGIKEEYSSDGIILFHTTPEGYRYAHTFEKARDVSMETRTEVVNLPDGTTLTFNYPVMTLVDNPDGEEVHRVSLVSFTAPTGEFAEYESGILKRLTFSGTQIHFDRIETKETFDPETGETTREIRLLDAVVFHSDGTITEFKDGKPFSVTSATGNVISIAPDVILSDSEGSQSGDSSASPQNDVPALINPSESAQFHYGEALKLWNDLVHPKWNEFQAPATLPVQIEYSAAVPGGEAEGSTTGGQILTRTFAEGVVELYEEGKIQSILAPDGELMVSYAYDNDGNPTQISMGASRRRLESAIKKLQAEVWVENQKALALVAGREQVINQTIEAQYIIARDRLLAIRAQVEGERNKVASIKVKGKKAKGILADGIAQIDAAIDQVNQALSRLAEERSKALAQLSEKVDEAKTQIQTETDRALGEIKTEGNKAKYSILKEEISPIVYHWYRKILGRDPSGAEYDAEISRTDFGAGIYDLDGLKADLNSRPELTARETEVNAIKALIASRFQTDLSNQSGRIAFAESLGIDSGKVVNLSSEEINSILTWLNSRSLHFGQSAYIALEALLDDAGLAHNRVDLASDLILIDILTGTITPLEQDDLVISLFALRRVAAHLGLNAGSLALTYDVLKQIFNEACPPDSLTPCTFRLIAHINGNHYVIITGFETKQRTELKARTDADGRVQYNADGSPIIDQVTVLDSNQNPIIDEYVKYIDPGAGPESALDQLTILKGEFLKTWIDPKKPQSQLGYVLSPRAPPSPEPPVPGEGVLESSDSSAHYRILNPNEEMSIRGAFFPFLVVIFFAIAAAVKAAVVAAIVAVTGLISGLVSGIGTILSSFGSFFTGLFSTNFLTSVQGLFGGLLTGLGQIGGGFVSAFTAIHAGLLSAIQGIAGAVYQLGSAVLSSLTANFALSSALKLSLVGLTFEGTGRFLNAIGISPKITQFLISGGKIAAGIGFLATGNPLGIATSLGLIGGGTGEFLNLATTLPPLLTNVISIGATALGAFAGGYFNPDTIGGAIGSFKAALPFLSMDLASAGLVGIGDALHLDPRLTSLISVPIRAAVGMFADSLIYAGQVNPTSLFAAIKNGLAAGAKSIGLGFGQDSLLRSITSSSLLSTIGSSITSGDIFNQFFSRIKDLALSPFNLIGNLASSFKTFTSVIQEKGLAGALGSFANSIFKGPTLDAILNAGGIGSFLDDLRLDTILPTGIQAKELKIGNAASLFFDVAGKFIGILENGIYRLGEFVVDTLGQVKLVAGKLIANLFGNTVEGDIENGTIRNFKTTIDGILIEGEGDDGVWIPGPIDEPGGLGALFSGIIRVAGNALAFVFESGILTQILTTPDAEASEILPLPIGLPGIPLNLAELLLNALKNNGVLDDSDVQKIKDNFTWLIHYTDKAGFDKISQEEQILAGDDGAFMSKEIPDLTKGDSLNPLGGPRREIAMDLQLHYDDSDHINPEKAMYFFLVDSSEFNDPLIRPVARETDLSDPDGNQQPDTPTTGATEYVFNHTLHIAEKIIYSGLNTVIGWGAALLKLLEHFITKAKS